MSKEQKDFSGGLVREPQDPDKQAALIEQDRQTVSLLQYLLGGPAPTKCRHGKTESHGYGMADEPDYDGGEIRDMLLQCDGSPDF